MEEEDEVQERSEGSVSRGWRRTADDTPPQSGLQPGDRSPALRERPDLKGVVLRMDITRREAIKIGAGAGASMFLGWRPLAAQASELITKPIPSSGERVPVVGLGARNYRLQPDKSL